MALMYLLFLLVRRGGGGVRHHPPSSASPGVVTTTRPQPFFDFVDVARVDLYRDEHEDGQVDKHEDDARARRLHGRARWAWAVYYLVA